ncbi:hypothetical protein Vadar_023342 [Vaccinium darrowii]|uniref:Uncharacterized protein n=1 Tax=Vaccinium darrowii TaxID=229202 RepID=A0ACB7YFJ3_9ERIC|nr:hypothetical protein Vadar_023342 [Vaccinium darrowii]
MPEFEKLPVENVIDILARLSVTSLGRCRCVSKSWRSLISDPIFINEQLSINRDRRRIDGDHHHYSYIKYSDCSTHKYVSGNSSTYHSLRCQNSCREHKKIEKPWLTGVCTITSSCNGILSLLHCHPIGSVYFYAIFLWNPLIKKIKILPKPHFQTSASIDESVAIGFVPQANEYKVVRLNLARTWDDSSPQTIEIYSLRKDSWRTWTGEDIQWRLFGDTSNVSVNGSIYWKARKNVCDGDSQLIVISFHLADEVFKEISLPEYHRAHPDREVWFISVSVIHEKLAFSIARGSETPYKEEVLEIWLLEESYNGESWTKFRNLIFHTDMYMEDSRFIENGEFALNESWNNRLIVLDPKTQRIVANHGSRQKVLTCTESLVLLNEGIDVSSTEMWKFALDLENEKIEACRKMEEEEKRRRVINEVIGAVEAFFPICIMGLMAIIGIMAILNIFVDPFFAVMCLVALICIYIIAFV